MNKALCSLMIVLWIPNVAAALGVSDATTHIYLSEQVSQLTEQLKVMQAQLQEAMNANETLTKSYEAVTGSYDRVTGVYDDVMKTKAFLNDSYNTVMRQFKHYMALYEDLSDPDKGDFETVKELLEGVFDDPRTSTPEQNRKRAEQEYQVRQAAYKKAIEDSEDILGSMSDRMEKVQTLGGKIGKGKDLKESQALTNSLLLEILIVLQEQLSMSMRFQQAMALSEYSGVTEDSIAARASAIKAVVERKDVLDYELSNFRRAGIDDITDIKAIMKQAAQQ
ncbi:type IV secretion system protein [Pseudodesulfovibrio karagichevae]|uniref:Type IV secretion system protein n=1 Tax=Pseudodesulfovibrio karagichevae TaxID=3239305 RepID=A0ABV4K526_9BACT